MSISLLLRLALTALFAVIALLVGSIWWSVSSLDHAFNQNDSYHRYAQRINQEIQIPINDYLLSGNATVLQDINNNIVQLKTSDSMAGLPARLHSQLASHLSVLHDSLKTLREAGKLANPQALLIQNERESNQTISSLRDYITDAPENKMALKNRYLTTLVEFQELSNQRTHARERYFEQSDSATQVNLNQLLELIQQKADDLYALPRLGVMAAAEEDDLAVMLGLNIEPESQTAAEDKGEEILSQLKSLASRYSKELANAQRYRAMKEHSNREATTQLTTLADNFEAVEQTIATQQQEIKYSVYLTLAISILCITAICTYIGTVMYKLSRVLIRTARNLNSLSSGDLKTQAPLRVKMKEVVSLESSIDSLRSFLTLLLSEIRNEVDQLHRLQTEAQDSADHLTGIVANQRDSSTNAAAQMGQLKISFEEVAEHATRTNDATQNALSLVESGCQRVNTTGHNIQQLATEVDRTASALSDLERDTASIKDVLEVIRGFAEQTNLLALNAAIEAARAGDSGRGFAVVADEVRNLATNTARSADDIQAIIERLSTTTTHSVERMTQQKQQASAVQELAVDAEQAIDQIRQAIFQINDMNAQIATATRQQSSSTLEINSAMEHSSHTANHAFSAAENSKQHAIQLARVSKQLKTLISQLH